MRLRKLLLGSTAVLFAGGMASAPASAAEPIAPMGVTPMATMVDYLQACADGEGWQLSEWCFSVSGEVGFEASFGWDIDYGGEDADGLEDGDQIIPFPGTVQLTLGNAYSYEGPPFPLSDNYELCLTATRETDTGTEIEIRFPTWFDSCGSGWPRLRITGPGGTRFTFEDDEFEIMRPTGFGALTLTLEENDDDEEALVVPWPTPTLAAEFAFGNFDVELEAGLGGYYMWGLGAWGIAPSFSAEIGFDAGNFEVTLFGLAAWRTFDDLSSDPIFNTGGGPGDATGQWGYEADLTMEATLGPVELEVGGHVATVSVFPDGGGREFGGPPWYPMAAFAWGVHAIAEVGFGMTTVSGGVLYGVNDDFGAPGDLRGNPYTVFVDDRILLAFGGLGFEWNDFHETEFLTTYTSILGAPGWSTLEIGVEHTFLPYGDDVIELTGELWWKTDLDGPLPGGAFGGEIGITVPIF